MKNRQGTPSAVLPEEQAHRRQFLWQILLPILGVTSAALIVTILVVLSAGSANNLNAKWAMLSTILLILPWLFLSLIPLAFVVLGIWLLKRTHRAVIPYLVAASQYSQRLKIQNANLMQLIAAPFIKVRSVYAGIAYLLRLVFHIKTSPKE